MKHTLKITALLLTMFVVTQAIGLYVVNYYSPADKVLPFGLEPPQPTDYGSVFIGILFAFIIAISIFFLFTRFKLKNILKIWFLIVVTLALSISLIAILPIKTVLVSFIIAAGLAVWKMWGRNFLVHNLTELLIYPGIAAVFVPILNVWTVLALLVLISVYDMWAVWHSGIMQKMAKYQIDNLKIFSGFFVPYVGKRVKNRIKKWKKTLTKKQLNKKRIRVNVAILGGGDVVFPIITAGVMLMAQGIVSAILVIAGATLGLSYLFFFAEKKKFYPAMPFITLGILVGLGVSYLIL